MGIHVISPLATAQESVNKRRSPPSPVQGLGEQLSAQPAGCCPAFQWFLE